MSAAADSGGPARRNRLLRPIRKAAQRFRRGIGIRLGFLPPPADRGYMICATSRSGSSYLCRLLASTGMLGDPLEYFNTGGRRRRDDPNYPASRQRQLDIIRTLGATSNGIYAVKVIAPQLNEIGERIDVFRDLPNLVLVRLRRQDLLGQALSLARARQTGQFVASDRQKAAPSYSPRLIRSCLHSVREQEAIWDAVERRRGLHPLAIAYEDVLDDQQQAVDRIAMLMGLPLPAPIDRALVTHAIQRDGDSAEWRARFLAETADELPDLSPC